MSEAQAERKPEIIAETGDYRLVKKMRDKRSWPNSCDLTLETRTHDAMGVETWKHLDSFYVTAINKHPTNADERTAAIFALILGLGVEQGAR